MTKKRDRYQSGFDGDMRGVRSAVYDLGLALMILEEIAKEFELLRERKTFHGGQSWTVAQVLEIAKDALDSSVSPVVEVYERLRQNAHAAEVVSQAGLDPSEPILSDTDFALWMTLKNSAILPRGKVSKAERILAQRAKESEASA